MIGFFEPESTLAWSSCESIMRWLGWAEEFILDVLRIIFKSPSSCYFFLITVNEFCLTSDSSTGVLGESSYLSIFFVPYNCISSPSSSM